jgi:hypothetical protein
MENVCHLHHNGFLIFEQRLRTLQCRRYCRYDNHENIPGV